MKRYHRTEVSSSWEAALLRGNTGERTQTVCCRHRSHWYCWHSHTCPAHRPGCKVQGRSARCRSSRALNAASGYRWFAEREKETKLLCDKCFLCIWPNITSWIINSQTPCMNPAQPPVFHLPLHRGPHSHHLVDGLSVCCQTQWGWFCDLHL